MTHADTIFETERPKLTALCYRMLGERAGAEDVVQETWLRWARTEPDNVDNPAAWLRRTATNIAIDALRSARTRRETYVGPWLPEPLIETEAHSVEAAFELAQECELALLWAMDRLNATERAAFILREAFDAGYDDIARVLEQSEAACRQLVSRAHKRLQASGPRFDTPREETERLLERFFAAAAADDFESALDLLAPDAVAITDGGRKARAARRPLVGPEDIIQVFRAVWSKENLRTQWLLEPCLANGSPALIQREEGRVVSIMTLASDAVGRIAWIYILRNPDKLTLLNQGVS